ncbi:MAG: hypothetical protein QF410_13365 [Planctomycetota bacterium]|nr:hypothetical protein [Planctomycetota bacterium]
MKRLPVHPAPARVRRRLGAVALALVLCAGCGDGGGDGYIDGILSGGADPTGVYDAGYTVLTSTGCGLSPDDTGSILLVITPAAAGAYRVHVRLDGATDIGPYAGTISAVAIGQVELSVSGVGALNEGTPNEILYDLTGTTLVAGGGSVSGTLAEAVSGAANCTVTRAVSGSIGSGSSDLSGSFDFEIATIEADGGCPDATADPAEELTGTFTDLGSDSYQLSLDDGAGDVDSLDVTLSGETLAVSGSFSEQDGASSWTVTVDASAITIHDDFITGSLDVTLTGDVECQRVLGVYAERSSSGLVFGGGLFSGAWLSASAGTPRPVSLNLDGVPLGARGAFAAVSATRDQRMVLSGRLVTPFEIVGRITLCRAGGASADGGPLRLRRVGSR